ncbi:MAG: hypothetical protein KAW09_02145 [Thermoplasmata archaeon]|nr:hypothetical protein [Thermoplasmata archaeon]
MKEILLPRVMVAIPAYNEETAIGSVVIDADNTLVRKRLSVIQQRVSEGAEVRIASRCSTLRVRLDSSRLFLEGFLPFLR